MYPYGVWGCGAVYGRRSSVVSSVLTDALDYVGGGSVVMLCFLSIVEEFVELFGGDDLDLALSAVAVLDGGFGFAAGVVFAADEVVGVRLGATVPCATVGGDPIAECVAVGEPVWNGAANAKRESVDGRFGIDF